MSVIFSPQELDRLLIDSRSLAESQMRSTCLIERTTGAITQNDDGDDVAEHTQIYLGKCRITDFNAHPSTPELTGQKITINQPRVLIPVSSPLVKVGDRITITANPDNPVNSGRVLLVVAVRTKDGETARNLICDDIQSGTK